MAKKTFLDSLRSAVGGGKGEEQDGAGGQRRDLMNPFIVAPFDIDATMSPAAGRARPIPNELPQGTVLVSQRLGIKCLLLEPLAEVGQKRLKELCGHKLKADEAVYLPMGSQILREEILHQSREFVIKLRKGTLFLSPGGHPDGYLFGPLNLPLRKELSRIDQFLPITEKTAKRYLQSLVNLPASFSLVKEDVLYGAPEQESMRLEKGTLMISRSGALTGLMLDDKDIPLPLRGPLSDVAEFFPLKATYQRHPIESLIQQANKTSSHELELERGTFLFSSQGKIYFVWRHGVKATEPKLSNWSKASQVSDPGIVEVSLQKSNIIGGPGEVITQEELNYLRDVFSQAGTTNIHKDTLLLENNLFYKFNIEMPYAQSGKFRGYLATGGVSILNTFRRGTFSVELGNKGVEISDLDLVQVRKHLQPEGRLLIKMETKLRITDEKFGDWIYRVRNNLFYPYETLTRPYLEEFVPEYVAMEPREPKMSTLIGFQKKPRAEDLATDGAPVTDLLTLINGELTKKRIVFVLDGALFHWKNRMYRTNSELVFRPRLEKLLPQDLEALEAEWKIHQLVEEKAGEEAPPQVAEEGDLEDLPFDTGSMR